MAVKIIVAVLIVTGAAAGMLLARTTGQTDESAQTVEAVQGQDTQTSEEVVTVTSGDDVITAEDGDIATSEVDEDPAIEEFLAPDFTLPQLGGGEITLSDYRGDKPVVLDFWASWCHNCRRDMPVQNELYKKYQDQVEVIGVNLEEKESTVQRYIDREDIVFPIALDDGAVASDYGIHFTNTHILINTDGTVFDIFPGDIQEGHFEQLIQKNS